MATCTDHSNTPAPERPDTLPTVIAEQARGRSPMELWTTAVGGGVNAILLLAQFPALAWLGAGFSAAACYGVWGLLDRKLTEIRQLSSRNRGAEALLMIGRVVATVVGTGAALIATAAFLTIALRGLSMPGR